MKYEIIQEPFLFLETMEALYKHVNGFKFSDMWNPLHEYNATPIEQVVRQRLTLLQEILDEACQGVDPNDPLLRRYFEFVDMEQSSAFTYLARYMVSAFVDYKRPGFDETVEDILAEWEKMNREGGWLARTRGSGLLYRCVPGSPGDLFAQIYKMDLPAEFRLRLYGALHCFPESLRELTELMRPVAVRLGAAFAAAGLPQTEMTEYWLRTPVGPLEFLADSAGPEAVQGAGEHLRLSIGLMSANEIIYAMEHEPGRERPYNYMHIGCCISVNSLLKEHSIELDYASATLRGIGERKRLEVLHQLSKKRLYGAEIAEIMGMDRGNLSRLLLALHSQGFLKQEKENQRTYYQADREAMQSFFDGLIATIFD